MHLVLQTVQHNNVLNSQEEGGLNIVVKFFKLKRLQNMAQG